MAKSKPCTVILNTRWGYCLAPYPCKSIKEAVDYGKSSGMAYRVFADGKIVRRGTHKV